jgi:class 3 adenylate cyclase
MMFRQTTGQRDPSAIAANLERRQVSLPLASALARFLVQAPARALIHFNPRALAEQLDLNERATLRLLLAALEEGVVILNWEVRCPACGTINHRGDTLADLHGAETCSACTTHFALRLDAEVRVTFSVHERVRTLGQDADDAIYRAEVDDRLGVVSGHALLLLPEFRRLFPQQRLLPDESLQISRVAILFTDLAGSTLLYAQRGDPRAFHLVRLHFDELFQVSDEQGGLMIKAIGDAVMAAFQTPAEALRAAQAMQHAVAALNERAQLGDDEQLILKVGVHVGPGLSVTLNGQPDYFGTTVNLAARVQRLAQGGDVVFTQEVCTDQEVRTLLGSTRIHPDRATLRGIAVPVQVYRWPVLDAV